MNVYRSFSFKSGMEKTAVTVNPAYCLQQEKASQKVYIRFISAAGKSIPKNLYQVYICCGKSISKSLYQVYICCRKSNPYLVTKSIYEKRDNVVVQSCA